MIEKREYYVVKCDKCGDLMDDMGDGFTVYDHPSDADDVMWDLDWVRDGEKTYCSGCGREEASK